MTTPTNRTEAEWAALDGELDQALDDGLDESGERALRARIEAQFAERRRPPRTAAVMPHVYRAAAAVLLLACGALAGYLLAERNLEARIAALEEGRRIDTAAMERAVNEALESRLSGQTVRWQNPATGASGTITPVRTYRARNGQWCREFTRNWVRPGGTDQLRGIACRQDDGRWLQRLTLSDREG
ncbi:RT0821/Lpp0805 family surface protein [Oceanibacterium hippocampi]|uniref:Surface antigen domain-containing protein n=1 Tax=Oceanibacterium hippocampi TaxID=745714 RepID=A0A1Y5S2F6_9PROT|nr:RT0821/Lpp0805 family surface protein [Oceanibacterium hippocampi]SLN29736.1 hypothetical protein OCH7691_01031 [Oceanibacterium hippocampi]